MHSYTVVHYAGEPGAGRRRAVHGRARQPRRRPDIRVVGNIDGTDVTIGMPVVATWEERTAEDGTVILLPQWVPA